MSSATVSYLSLGHNFVASLFSSNSARGQSSIFSKMSKHSFKCDSDWNDWLPLKKKKWLNVVHCEVLQMLKNKSESLEATVWSYYYSYAHTVPAWTFCLLLINAHSCNLAEHVRDTILLLFAHRAETHENHNVKATFWSLTVIFRILLPAAESRRNGKLQFAPSLSY